jgi:hypothetical protein
MITRVSFKTEVKGVGKISLCVLYYINGAPCHKLISTKKCTIVNTYTVFINAKNSCICFNK